MMFHFAEQRRRLLQAEFLRMAGELPALGIERFYAAGDLAAGDVGPDSDLEILIVHRTTEPFQRRADFFTTHLRPDVGTQFLVYTPSEAEALAQTDPVLRRTLRTSDPVEA